MQLSSEWICQVLGVEHPFSNSQFIRSIGTDSRTVEPGECFVALVGEHYDGHDYVAQALQQGATMAIVTRPISGPCCVVPDTTQALLRLAQATRLQFPMPMVAITGSCGKTSTREILNSILQQRERVLASEGSFNNHIGVPKTVLKLWDQGFDVMVQEMGANHPGEIATLVDAAMPEHVVITNIAPCHTEGFGGIDGVARAKSEILDEEYVSGDGIAVLPADSDYFDFLQSKVLKRRLVSFGFNQSAEVYATDVCLYAEGARFTLRIGEQSCCVVSSLLGRHNIENMLAAAAAASGLGMRLDQIQQGLQQAGAVGQRLQLKAGLRGATILDDSYNANPRSMQAALEVLAAREGTRILVVADMGELGDDAMRFHQEIGRLAADLGIDDLLGYGPLSQHCVTAFQGRAQHFEQQQDLIQALVARLDTGVSVLVKGSNSMRMHQVVQAVIQGK